MSARAERRRDFKARVKATDYAESGFKDRAIYRPAPVTTRTGSTHNGAYTAEELHQRAAVARRDQRRAIEKLITEQTKAGAEAGAERKAVARAARRKAYLAACAKPQPIKYLHSAARRRAEAQPLALAA